MRYEKIRVTLDGCDDSFECWSNGELWNGWAKAYFEPERAMQFIDGVLAECRPAGPARVTEQGLEFEMIDTGETEVWPARTIETADGLREVYLADGWCFYEPEEHTCDDECRSRGCREGWR